MKKITLIFLALSLTLLVACTEVETTSTDYTSETVLKAFQNANLPTTDPRDNSHNCDSLKCISVITTEDISIYEWNTQEEAKKQESVSVGDEYYSNGRIYIRINSRDGNIDDYKETLDSIVSTN